MNEVKFLLTVFAPLGGIKIDARPVVIPFAAFQYSANDENIHPPKRIG